MPVAAERRRHRARESGDIPAAGPPSLGRREFLRIAAVAGLGVAGAAELAACTREPAPAPSPVRLGPNLEGVTNVLGGIPVSSGSLFPGGIARQHDGSFYVDYMHGKTSTHAVVRGRRLASLEGTAGVEEDLFGGVAIDPSVVTMPTGQTVILLHRGGQDWLITRNEDATFTTPLLVGPAGESMVSWVGDRVFVAYADAHPASPFWMPVYVREILTATTAGPQIDTGARTGAASSNGAQAEKRSSVGGIGASDLLLAWNQPQSQSGGYRSIWAARSVDGKTWSSHVKVADTGGNIRNPFVLKVSDSETHVYFVQGGTSPLGMVKTTDGGKTWSDPSDVGVPPTVNGAPRPSMFLDNGRIYCFSVFQAGPNHLLAIFPLPS